MKLLAFVASVFLNLFTVMAFAVEDPEAYVRALKVVRLYVDSAPGFGHQSAGASVMQRLREIGFTGVYEVVYQPSVAAKLARIYPAFPEGIEKQVGYLTVQDYQSSVKAGQAQRVSLSISGADDGFGDTFAQVAMADTYLRLQPLGWGVSRYYGQNAKLLNELTDLPLANLNRDARIESLQPAMQEFLARYKQVAKENFSFPIYGVGVQAFAAQKIYFYAKSVLSAVRRMDEKKSVIVPVVSNFSASEYDSLMKVFGKMPGFEAATEHELRQQNRFHFLSTAEFTAIETLRPGHVYFVMTGSVPQSVFNHFYETATLPVWVAGKNAMSFAATKGKPYLNTVDDYHLPDTQSLPTNAERLLRRALAAFNSGFHEYANQPQLAALTQFIQESSTSGTELNKFYSRMGKRMSMTDKVLESIRAIPDAKQCGSVF